MKGAGPRTEGSKQEAFEYPFERQVVGFGAAGGENDRPGIGIEAGFQGSSGRFQLASALVAQSVGARRIAGAAHGIGNRLDDFG